MRLFRLDIKACYKSFEKASSRAFIPSKLPVKNKSRQFLRKRPHYVAQQSPSRLCKSGSRIMAKGQVRGNKEAKKPKQPKKVESPAAAVSWATPKKSAEASASVKKK